MTKMLIDKEDWDNEMDAATIVKQYMDRIVLDYLVCEGYLTAAERFIDESFTQGYIFFLLSFLSVVVIFSLCCVHLVDESITERVAVVNAIKSGELDVAIEKLRAFKPEILGNFHLLKQQFIELVREGRNVDAFDFAERHLKLSPENMASLKQVEEVISLLVFENLPTCPVKDFLGESQWLKTASEVNAAILSSFGKGPKLHRLLKKLTLNQKQLDERAYEYPRMSDMSIAELIYPQE